MEPAARGPAGLWSVSGASLHAAHQCPGHSGRQQDRPGLPPAAALPLPPLRAQAAGRRLEPAHPAAPQLHAAPCCLWAAGRAAAEPPELRVTRLLLHCVLCRCFSLKTFIHHCVNCVCPGSFTDLSTESAALPTCQCPVPALTSLLLRQHGPAPLRDLREVRQRHLPAAPGQRQRVSAAAC